MKTSNRIVLAAILMVLASPWALADDLPVGDPRVGVGGGGSSTPVGISFMFSSPSGTDTFAFQNATEVTFQTLAFDVDGSFPPETTSIGCDLLTGSPFGACSAGFDADGLIFNFSGGSGVLAGQHFSVVVTDFPANTKFFGAANGAPFSDVPEPATSALCLIGIALLGGGRAARRRRS